MKKGHAEFIFLMVDKLSRPEKKKKQERGKKCYRVYLVGFHFSPPASRQKRTGKRDIGVTNQRCRPSFVIAATFVKIFTDLHNVRLDFSASTLEMLTNQDQTGATLDNWIFFTNFILNLSSVSTHKNVKCKNK